MKKSSVLFVALMASWAFISCNDASQQSTTADENAVENAKDSTIGTDQHIGDTASKMDDSNFMTEAASGGMMEVELGKIAQQKAKNKRVKNFGAMMVKDHTQANNDLKALAANKNVSIPAAMSEEHQKHVADMKQKAGDDFDKAYMSMMVDDHEKDISKFEDASNKANDADLKGFATKTLPVLRTHLDSAKAIHSAMNK